MVEELAWVKRVSHGAYQMLVAADGAWQIWRRATNGGCTPAALVASGAGGEVAASQWFAKLQTGDALRSTRRHKRRVAP